MTDTPRFTTHRFDVVMGDPEDGSTITTHQITAIGRDIQAVETLFAKRNYGDVAKRPITSATALAYFAMVRTGKFAGDFDEFERNYIEVTPVGQQTINPTDAALDTA